jgi:hypothetical protein
MNGGVMATGRGGRLTATSSLPNSFNGGAPVVGSGALCVSETMPQTFCHGLGYRNDGRVCVDFVGPVTGSSRAGLPMAADGRVACSEGKIVVGYVHGLPYDMQGRVAIDVRPVIVEEV